MDIHEHIAEERNTVASMLEGLSPEQLAHASLCSEWNVREVGGHLCAPFAVSLPAMLVRIVKAGGSFNRANERAAKEIATKPVSELAGILRKNATTKFKPPGAGYDAPLTDLIVHGLDIRRPLGLARAIPAERWTIVLGGLTAKTVQRFFKSRVDGLRLVADDVDWSHGGGPTLTGSAENLALTLAGRRIGLDGLSGDGVAALRSRLTAG